MSTKLVLLDTLASASGLFDRLCAEILPADVEVFHISDENLLDILLREGGLSPLAYSIVVDHVVAAERGGADFVQLTCSSISPCVDVARLMVSIPVLKVDEPMVDRAISIGQRIGVAATASTTLRPTVDLVRSRADRAGRTVVVDAVLCNGAYEALLAKDIGAHDRIVRAVIVTMASRNDVVALAQGSMAHVVDTIPAGKTTVPILSSPRLAIERVRDTIKVHSTL